MTISIIIPIYNEAAGLPALLSQSQHWPVLEVVFVDGGSADQSLSLIQAWMDRTLEKGAKTPSYRLLVSKKGRGCQMNAGARVAAGAILFFLHADSLLPDDCFPAMVQAFCGQCVGGAFRLKIGLDSMGLKWIAMMANLRSALFGLPYGDQGLFVDRGVFQRLGGYLEIPIMEDVDFIRRLRRQAGKIVLLDKVITTSARRWNREGIMWASTRNVILLLLYFMGVAPERLLKWRL
ncbi:MAG: TIGR04283 family arsenosugar biosynthesis glycosyltransferase [Nitrospirota bacterium]